ncbi:hypothetical protein DPMN_139908 [Dreissena polymorpha]|uniref:Uncharacterized protein n=1 Tax=Dreissena polymorpha TaxID=45954 RepID=A0A9D4G9Z0_DREPO|nr:hypothetical protein DPMN_139731 [Dreissena polymorpha]KAH3811498.1 hypothetical protein DPMN_139908 [Dreissena polymorpha]
MLETYFLLKNDILSEDDLLGRSHNNPEVMYINEGRVAGLAYARNNRVYPIAESTSSGVYIRHFLLSHFIAGIERWMIDLQVPKLVL